MPSPLAKAFAAPSHAHDFPFVASGTGYVSSSAPSYSVPDSLTSLSPESCWPLHSGQPPSGRGSVHGNTAITRSRAASGHGACATHRQLENFTAVSWLIRAGLGAAGSHLLPGMTAESPEAQHGIAACAAAHLLTAILPEPSLHTFWPPCMPEATETSASMTVLISAFSMLLAAAQIDPDQGHEAIVMAAITQLLCSASVAASQGHPAAGIAYQMCAAVCAGSPADAATQSLPSMLAGCLVKTNTSSHSAAADLLAEVADVSRHKTGKFALHPALWSAVLGKLAIVNSPDKASDGGKSIVVPLLQFVSTFAIGDVSLSSKLAKNQNAMNSIVNAAGACDLAGPPAASILSYMSRHCENWGKALLSSGAAHALCSAIVKSACNQRHRAMAALGLLRLLRWQRALAGSKRRNAVADDVLQHPGQDGVLKPRGGQSGRKPSFAAVVMQRSTRPGPAQIALLALATELLAQRPNSVAAAVLQQGAALVQQLVQIGAPLAFSSITLPPPKQAPSAAEAVGFMGLHGCTASADEAPSGTAAEEPVEQAAGSQAVQTHGPSSALAQGIRCDHAVVKNSDNAAEPEADSHVHEALQAALTQSLCAALLFGALRESNSTSFGPLPALDVLQLLQKAQAANTPTVATIALQLLAEDVAAQGHAGSNVAKSCWKSRSGIIACLDWGGAGGATGNIRLNDATLVALQSQEALLCLLIQDADSANFGQTGVPVRDAKCGSLAQLIENSTEAALAGPRCEDECHPVQPDAANIWEIMQAELQDCCMAEAAGETASSAAVGVRAAAAGLLGKLLASSSVFALKLLEEQPALTEKLLSELATVISGTLAATQRAVQAVPFATALAGMMQAEPPGPAGGKWLATLPCMLSDKAEQEAGSQELGKLLQGITSVLAAQTTAQTAHNVQQAAQALGSNWADMLASGKATRAVTNLLKLLSTVLASHSAATLRWFEATPPAAGSPGKALVSVMSAALRSIQDGSASPSGCPEPEQSVEQPACSQTNVSRPTIESPNCWGLLGARSLAVAIAVRH